MSSMTSCPVARWRSRMGLRCFLYWPAIAPSSILPASTIVISKGTDPEREAYSGFQDTSLHQHLQSRGITRVFVGGLATDYCVLQTVRDARSLGYGVCLLLDAVRAVNLHPEDGRKAETDMMKLGAVPVRWSQLAA
ncbi:MAG: pncA [Nitrospira sp.]|nr:pncA [Nitrospira sp.]